MKQTAKTIAIAFLIATSLFVTACSAKQADASPQGEIPSEPVIETEVSTDNQQSSTSTPSLDDVANTNDEATLQKSADNAINEASDIAEEISIVPNEILGGSTLQEAQMLNLNERYVGAYSGADLWVSFTTADHKGDEYAVTLENLTVGSDLLCGYLYDGQEEIILPANKNYDLHRFGDKTFAAADESGTAATGTSSTLAPSTTYYLRLEGSSEAVFSLRITNVSENTIPLVEQRAVIFDAQKDLASSNQDEAPILPVNSKYHGTYEAGYSWIAFTTNDLENIEYSVTLENVTVGSGLLSGYLYDEFGTRLLPTSKNYDLHRFGDETFTAADESGTAATGTINTLTPNTTYYLRLEGDSKADYIVTINDSSNSSSAESDNSTPEGNLVQGDTIIPGTSQSSALNIPLNTKVFGKYIGGHAWIAFTTNEETNTEYKITAVNCTVGSDLLSGHLYDKQGTLLQPTSKTYDLHRFGDETFTAADESGTAATGTINTLTPNTTYYLLLEGSSDAEYSVLVSTSSTTRIDAFGTSNSIEEAKGALDENASFYTGTNQNNATMLKLNVEYYGNYTDGFSWVAFTTTNQESAEYSITLENLTVGSDLLYGYLYDEFGTRLLPDSRNYDLQRFGDETIAAASEDGRAATGTITYLEPNTTYYIRIEGTVPVNYMIMIGIPEPEVDEESVEEEVVFEVPFELNETQVRFVANEAIFIDEEAAKAALAPVAEIILAHPDHPILLAGTTAHWGSQDSCINLSNRRAGAVKDLLVNYFGVPESQLVTAGLGYADDPFVRGQDVDSNGNFVETEGAKNRRVVVLDAESDIARQILGN